MLLIKIVLKDSKEYLEALSLRIDVLRKPLGLSYAQTDLDLEKDDIHFVAIKSNQVVGCLLLRPLSPTLIKMRQVAVQSDYQKLGIGQALVTASEEYARTQGILKIELSARKDAVPFYQRLGYLNTGEPYFEVTLPHQKMEKYINK